MPQDHSNEPHHRKMHTLNANANNYYNNYYNINNTQLHKNTTKTLSFDQHAKSTLCIADNSQQLCTLNNEAQH